MKKRLFQVLDEMNVNDEKNKTATCACCFDLVEAKTAKGGAHVIMGVPAEALHKLMLNEYKPMLVLLDMKEYNRLEKQPADEKWQEAQQLVERYEKALKKIAEWKLPATDRFWDHGTSHEPMSYEACYGSNGVRDYFKALAREALTPKTGSDE